MPTRSPWRGRAWWAGAGAGALAVLAFQSVTPALARAQLPRPRSVDYLTVAGVDDVRAAWVNPAGLSRTLEASIMAEAVVDRLPETRLIQYTLGMNSRGFSISYARDRTSATAPVSMTRLALGLPFPRGAVGVAVTLYRATARAEGVDVGLGYRLTPTADVAAVVRHLGGPVVRGVRTPVLAVAGARWQPVPRVITLDAEVAAADSGGGFTKEVQYRGMLRVATPGRSRVELLGGVELGSEGVARWVVGMSVGTANWLGGVGGASRGFGLDRPDRLSIAGVMSHRGSTVSR